MKLLAPAVTLALALTACGGSDGDGDGASEPDEAPATAAPTSEPSTTAEATTTAPPTTVVATTVAPTSPPSTAPPTTPPAGPPEGLGAFCAASERYYVTILALFDHVQSDAGAGFLVRQAIDDADASIAAAPDADFAGEPTAAREALVAIDAAFAPVEYDQEAVDLTLIEDPFATVEATNDALLAFLTDVCESDLNRLGGEAEALGVSVDAQYGQDVDEDAGVEPFEVTDDSGELRATVPGEWNDVLGTPDGEVRRLVASDSIDEFLNSYQVPGMLLYSGEAAGAADEARARKQLAVDAALSGGCQVQISAPYDDGVYTGQEDLLSCPGGDARLRAIGASNSADDVWLVLLLVVADGDDETRDLVVDSFFVD